MSVRWTAGTVLTVLVLAGSIIASYAVAQYQISEARADIKELQHQRQADREVIVEMKADVKWIRKALGGGE